MPFILELLIKVIVYFIIFVPLLGAACVGVAYIMIWIEETKEKIKNKKEKKK